MSGNNDACCPRFNPEPWEKKIHQWQNKRFVRAKVKTVFHLPVNFGAVMKKLDGQVRQAGASIPDNLCLSDHTSQSNMDVYLAVDREIPGLENVTLSGKFLSKVYEGDFKQTGKWCQDFSTYAQQQKRSIAKMYMWYTTCPRCAKKYGKNYVVIIAEVK